MTRDSTAGHWRKDSSQCMVFGQLAGYLENRKGKEMDPYFTPDKTQFHMD